MKTITKNNSSSYAHIHYVAKLLNYKNTKYSDLQIR